MKVRLTITRDLIITAAEAVTIAGPYAVCPMADVFVNLVGIQIGPLATGQRGDWWSEWPHSYHRLMGPVATIAYQTRYGEGASGVMENVASLEMTIPIMRDSRSQRSMRWPTAVSPMPLRTAEQRKLPTNHLMLRLRGAAQARECCWPIPLPASHSPCGVAAGATYPQMRQLSG